MGSGAPRVCRGGRSATPSGADEGVRAPVWLGKDYQLQRQATTIAAATASGWQRGHWRSLSPLAGPVSVPYQPSSDPIAALSNGINAGHVAAQRAEKLLPQGADGEQDQGPVGLDGMGGF